MSISGAFFVRHRTQRNGGQARRATGVSLPDQHSLLACRAMTAPAGSSQDSSGSRSFAQMGSGAMPAPILPLAEIALVDEAAAALGCEPATLMERAGELLAREAMRLAPEGVLLVACGPGNNGGDGYVCARHLAAAGRVVQVWPVRPAQSALCAAAAKSLPSDVPRLSAAPASAPALIIDCILGAGARGRPREPIAAALLALRGLKTKVLAADVPSGLGTELCLPATLTLCLQVAKAELLRPQARSATREFKTIDIGVPPPAYLEVQPACLRRFPPLRRTGHKGMHGELLIIGGGIFPGALEFCARAAIRTGCDMVRVWTAGEPRLPPTIIVHTQPTVGVQPADPEELTPLLARASCVLIGPGLGREAGGAEAAQQAFSLAIEMGVPVVVDADGISHLAEAIRALPEGDAKLVITPHRGEARTLLGSVSVDEPALHAFARPDRVLLAKAPVDLVSDGRRWQRNPRGNPRMAVGGTGDVLAGLTAGLLARGASPFDAARMAVLWCTTAGDALWAEQGPCYDSLDLIAELPRTLAGLLRPLDMWPPVTG